VARFTSGARHWRLYETNRPRPPPRLRRPRRLLPVRRGGVGGVDDWNGEMTKSANRAKTDKRKAPKSAWKPGESGNPAGRPKDGESWAAIIAVVGNMYPEDILELVGRNNDLGKQIALLPKGVQMKYLVTARVFAALMFEPTQGLWKELMERAEGKVTEKVDVTSNGETVGQEDADTRSEILRKLDSIATATGAGTIPKPADGE
jgi:hypothetical protein